MRFLHQHHIIDVYCFIDDCIEEPKKPFGGRRPLVSHSEIVTILVWSMLLEMGKTLKSLYNHILRYHRHDFPRMTSYAAFVAQCHRALPHLLFVLLQIMHAEAPARIMDSTFLEVCKLQRVDHHKVAKGIAAFGKNHQGWHYGFKLHASIDGQGRFCGLALTPADVHDIHGMKYTLNEHCRIAVGDSHYGARVMGRKIFEA